MCVCVCVCVCNKLRFLFSFYGNSNYFGVIQDFFIFFIEINFRFIKGIAQHERNDITLFSSGEKRPYYIYIEREREKERKTERDRVRESWEEGL